MRAADARPEGRHRLRFEFEFEFEFEPADQPGFTQGKGLPAGRSCMSTARYEFLFTVPIADLVRPPEHRNVYQQTVKG